MKLRSKNLYWQMMRCPKEGWQNLRNILVFLKNLIFFLFLIINFVSIFLQIYVSKNYGFTKFTREVYFDLKEKNMLIADGVGVQYKPDHGPLNDWKRRQTAA